MPGSRIQALKRVPDQRLARALEDARHARVARVLGREVLLVVAARGLDGRGLLEHAREIAVAQGEAAEALLHLHAHEAVVPEVEGHVGGIVRRSSITRELMRRCP
jgi:hypothetical protein